VPLSVTFYTRANCPLCDKAKAAIRSSGVDVDLVEVDIDADPELQRRFTDDVPVVYIHGKEAFRHFVHPQAFAAYARGTSGELAFDRAALPYDEIRALMNRLQPGWVHYNAHDLRREFKFANFADALAFTNRVGAIAEELDHHPDILLGWGKVVVMTWTHSAQGISRADFILASGVDSVVTV
jgi:4a-hydroxytetrahydrobiopterin dehydratase